MQAGRAIGTMLVVDDLSRLVDEIDRQIATAVPASPWRTTLKMCQARVGENRKNIEVTFTTATRPGFTWGFTSTSVGLPVKDAAAVVLSLIEEIVETQKLPHEAVAGEINWLR